jgi:hypothetical protein
VVPAVPLTITNGVVGIPADYWQGTVSPQGIAVMRNPKLSRVEAQIDRQGTTEGNIAANSLPTSSRGSAASAAVIATASF